tara:strand:- start:267 stop:1454 length:1188 start_codon:yes stop_codon:yes gene_type:complete
MSDCFGIVDRNFLSFNGLNFKWFYASIFILVGIIYNYSFFDLKKINSKKITKLNYLVILFTTVQIISLFLTLINGYSLFSIIPFLEFVPFIFIIPLTHIFYNTSYKELEKLQRYIVSLTILNCIIFLLTRFNLISFYDLNESFVGVDRDLVRSLTGWPIFLPIVFAQFYLKFNTKANKKIISILFLFLLVVLFSYTRSKLLSFGLMIVFTHILFTSIRIKTILKVMGGVLLFSIITLSLFEKNVTAFTERFSNEKGVDTVDYRYLGAAERISKTLNENPFFGLGFIYKNDADKLHLQYRSDLLLFPDMFWPNLISTTGLVGTVVFLYLLGYIGFLFFTKKHDINAQYFIIYLIGTIALTAASGHIFFRQSIVFSLLTAFHIALIYKKQNILKLTT